MSDLIDARGLSCPQPVVLTMRALKGTPPCCAVLVDNPAARENVTRFAQQAGYRVEVAEQAGEYHLTLTRRPDEAK